MKAPAARAFALAVVAGCAAAPPPAALPALPPPVAQPLELAALERWQLPSGLAVLALPRAGTGLVRVRAVVRAGRREEGLDRPGLAAFTAALVRTGAGGRSAVDIDQMVAAAGGLLDVVPEPDNTSITCRVLAAHLPVCLEVVASLLRHPTLVASEVAGARDELRASVSGRDEDGASLARAHFDNLLLGQRHPEGRMLETEDVDRLTRADAVDFWRRRYRPDSTLLAISGQVDSRGLRAAVSRWFGGWRAAAGGDRPGPAAAVPPAFRIRLVDHPQASQASLVLGHQGPHPDGGDWFPALLINHVLGGADLSSRLMTELRARRGLTYDVHTALDLGAEGSRFRVALATAPDRVGAALAATLAELRRMQRVGPTPDELLRARGFVAGSYPLRAERVDDLADALVGAQLAGLDDRFVRLLAVRLLAVDAVSIAAAAQRFLDPDRVAVAIVGDARLIGPQLARAGFAFQTVTADNRKPADRGSEH